MRVGIIGTGYVGLVTGTCLAALGHKVTCADIDKGKIALLQSGGNPIYELGLTACIKKNVHAKRLSFTLNVADVATSSDIIVIAVGTPPRKDGSADLQYIYAVAKTIGKNIKKKVVVMNKSTVPVGTAEEVQAIIKRYSKKTVPVVSCPEFLREGHAVHDFMHPDRIVIGTEDALARKQVLRLFKKLACPKLCTKTRTSELIKYASNAFLATKISFINEIANLSERVGADVKEVAEGMGLDPRIGRSFLQAGIGYGGSCFPKDVKALKQIAGGSGYDFKLLKAVIRVNNGQRKWFYDRVAQELGGVAGKRIAVLGLAFKGDTDDVRESAALNIVRWLLADGAHVTAYDPQAGENAQVALPVSARIVEDAYTCVYDAQAVIVATEWEEFVALDWKKVRKLMRGKNVFDGKNVLDKKMLEKMGFVVRQVGR